MAGGVKSVKVDVYQASLDTIFDTDVGKEVLDTTTHVLNRARVLCPVDQGNLRASHNVRYRFSRDRILGEVYTKVKYALAVHEGRRPLIIRPNKKKALAFVWHGQPMVRKWVFQPARHGRPWLRDALREVASERGYKMNSAAPMDSGSAT